MTPNSICTVLNLVVVLEVPSPAETGAAAADGDDDATEPANQPLPLRFSQGVVLIVDSMMGSIRR